VSSNVLTCEYTKNPELIDRSHAFLAIAERLAGEQWSLFPCAPARQNILALNSPPGIAVKHCISFQMFALSYD
jgi:hypothetical protein